MDLNTATHERLKSTLHLLDLGRPLLLMKMFSVPNQRHAHKLSVFYYTALNLPIVASVQKKT